MVENITISCQIRLFCFIGFDVIEVVSLSGFQSSGPGHLSKTVGMVCRRDPRFMDGVEDGSVDVESCR